MKSEAQPSWSPDGKFLWFFTTGQEVFHLYKINTDGRPRPIQFNTRSLYLHLPKGLYKSKSNRFTRTAQTYDDAPCGPTGELRKICWISKLMAVLFND